MPSSNLRRDSPVKTTVSCTDTLYKFLCKYDGEHAEVFTGGSENLMDDDTSISLKGGLECDRGKDSGLSDKWQWYVSVDTRSALVLE